MTNEMINKCGIKKPLSLEIGRFRWSGQAGCALKVILKINLLSHFKKSSHTLKVKGLVPRWAFWVLFVCCLYVLPVSAWVLWVCQFLYTVRKHAINDPVDESCVKNNYFLS